MLCLPFVANSSYSIGVIELVCQAWKKTAPSLWELLATLQVPLAFEKHRNFHAYSHKQKLHILYNLFSGKCQWKTFELGVREKVRRTSFFDIATPNYFSAFGDTALHKTKYYSNQASTCVANPSGIISLMQIEKIRRGETEHEKKITTVIHRRTMVISRSKDSIRQHVFKDDGIKKTTLLVKKNSNKTLVITEKTLLALGGEWIHVVGLKTHRSFPLHSPKMSKTFSLNNAMHIKFAQEKNTVALFYRGAEKEYRICRLVVWELPKSEAVFEWMMPICHSTFPAHIRILGRFIAGVVRGPERRLYLWDLKKQELIFKSFIKYRIIDMTFTPTQITLFSQKNKEVFNFNPL